MIENIDISSQLLKEQLIEEKQRATSQNKVSDPSSSIDSSIKDILSGFISEMLKESTECSIVTNSNHLKTSKCNEEYCVLFTKNKIDYRFLDKNNLNTYLCDLNNNAIIHQNRKLPVDKHSQFYQRILRVCEDIRLKQVDIFYK